MRQCSAFLDTGGAFHTLPPATALSQTAVIYVALPADAENESYGVLWVGHIARWMAVEDTFVILVVSDVEAGLLDFHIR